MTGPHNLIAIVPHARAQKFHADGWRASRQNGFTATMYLRFPDATAAMQAGRKLRQLVWAVEPA